MDESQTPNSVPNKVFKLEDPRQIEIYQYLKRLVSDGAASFYKDACRHMATKPPFESTTHIVGHLLREVESALRAVLTGITDPPSAGGDKHKKQIGIILEALGFEQEDPIAQAWLNMPGENGLHGMAHRDNLAGPRPVDNDFEDKWDMLNSILLAVLEKFETNYIKVFESLDELAAKTAPTQSDVDKLSHNMPNNRTAHEHFFSAITLPEWLPQLKIKSSEQSLKKILMTYTRRLKQHELNAMILRLKRMMSTLLWGM